MDWFEVDQRWSLYVESKEEYIEKFVIKGKFHQNVPRDIVDAFETVSYLMAHSYYHWPMYDEAMSKALLNMEMAIKQKAKLLNVATETTNVKGKVVNKKLVEITAGVLRDKHLQFLQDDFDRARNIRNSKMHPDNNSYIGAIGNVQGNIKLFINLINLLFFDALQLQELNDKRKQVKLDLSLFQRGLYILELDDNKILIDKVLDHKYIRDGKTELLLLLVNPLLTDTFEHLSNNRYSAPLIVVFKQFTLGKKVVEGTGINNSPIRIYPTAKAENITIHQSYLADLAKLSPWDIDKYRIVTFQKAAWNMEDTIYKHLW